MDALPIEEKNEVDYRSRIEGVMHACGHDAHMAVMLGVARYVVDNKLREGLKGNVRFIFQPAEEGVRGARAMIQDGVLENPHVDLLLTCHVTNDLPAGEVGIYESISNASSDRFTVRVRGSGAHAAHPHRSSDAVLAACFFVTQIQSIVSRNVDPTESAVVSVGVIRGGTAANILPEEVEIRGTVRAFNEEIRLLVRGRLMDFARALKESHALEEVDLEYIDGCPPCVNDPEAIALLRSAAEEVVGSEGVKTLQPKMGAEDFAFYAAERPSALMRLGTDNPATEPTGRGHSPLFNIEEGALITGVKIFTEALRRYLR